MFKFLSTVVSLVSILLLILYFTNQTAFQSLSQSIIAFLDHCMTFGTSILTAISNLFNSANVVK